jgi:phosphoglycolate phosphatase
MAASARDKLTPPMPCRLVLFDIDGTLITDRGAAREAYDTAIREVYGYSGDLHRYDFSGRTDPQITHMVLGAAGLSDDEIDACLPRLWEIYLANLARNATPDRVQTLPGIADLVDELSGRSDVLLALLTGNIEPGARLKLAAADLNPYFPFGAFGSDSPRREDLPPIAVERASAFDRHRFSGRDVVIIGDTIYDIRCGTPYGATTIAIASGKTAADTLLAENPHHFFSSAADRGGLLAAILGRHES